MKKESLDKIGEELIEIRAFLALLENLDCHVNVEDISSVVTVFGKKVDDLYCYVSELSDMERKEFV